MCKKFTPDELNQMDHTAKNDVIFQMQDRLDKLEQNYETLIEQVRLANQQRFGRQTEKLDDIAGQLSFFNEAEANYDETAPEPVMEEVIESAKKGSRKSKKKGQREEDLKDFPQEEISHDIPEQELNEAFGSGNWKSMPDEIFWQLRFEPARWIAEKHVIKVYVGTDGTHQDEFLRGDHPATLFKGSIAPPSLEAAIINSKYVNSNPLDRISRDFGADGLEQYLKLERDQEGIKNANCMAHARRHFANAIKAIGKSNPEAIQSSIAHKALVRIGAVYDLRSFQRVKPQRGSTTV